MTEARSSSAPSGPPHTGASVASQGCASSSSATSSAGPAATPWRSGCPALRERWQLDCVVINGENAAGGFGITEAICDEILAAGADAVTLGNHSLDQREALVFIERQPRLAAPGQLSRPARPAAAPTWSRPRHGARVLVVNVMGRAVHGRARRSLRGRRARARAPARSAQVADAVVVDIHAEATSEKQAHGAYHLDGRASLVVGTHTHVPTADHRILPGGTAYMSDAGMCGDYESVLGMAEGGADAPLPAEDARRAPGAGLRRGHAVSGIAVETDDRTGLRLRGRAACGSGRARGGLARASGSERDLLLAPGFLVIRAARDV